MPRPLFTPRKDPVPIVQEVVWALGPVWTGAKNLTPTRIQSPDRPARSQSLYQDQHMHLNFTDVLLLLYGHKHVLTIHVAIFRVNCMRN